MKFSELLRKLFSSRADESRGGMRGAAPAAPDEEATDVDPFNPFTEPVCLEIRDVFDLHTIAPRDVSRVVEEYLGEARRAGFRSVRIIHGKGVGVQREIVRSILARTPFVEHFSDAPPEAGGWGATVARLSAHDSIDVSPDD
ncbi:MAG TPA: Smr/MutS family protein [Pyrinomonadaceae bacterium]|jgi:dsDNA-specific endonuclease/ATPase MutS2|nr:Smr/MutS family protein [Pyrinomonadaceae bacterium]